MNFDFEAALNYLCNQTNFRYCRLNEQLEDNSCPIIQKKIGGFLVADITFLIFGSVVGLFLIFFIGFLKGIPVQYKKQRKSRGLHLWRGNLVFWGLSILCWVASVSIFPSDGPIQHYLLIARGCLVNTAQTLLLIITLIDIQVIPNENLSVDIFAFILSLGIGSIFALNILKPNILIIVLLGFIYPLGCTLFFLLGMIPVVIFRGLFKCFIYLILIGLCLIGTFLIELFLNNLICEKINGGFTSPSLSVLVFAFYRVFLQLYFFELKKSEKYDGLPVHPKKVEDVSSSEINKPLPIDLSDYSYSYTHSES